VLMNIAAAATWSQRRDKTACQLCENAAATVIGWVSLGNRWGYDHTPLTFPRVTRYL